MSGKKIFNSLWVRTFVILILLISVIALQKSHLNRILAAKEVDYFQQEKSLRVIINVKKKLPSLGFENLIADWTFLRFIQYFGDGAARQATGYSLVPDYFEAIVQQDPRFIKALLVLSTSNSVFAGEPARPVALLEQALEWISPKYFPTAYFIWIYKGIDEILFLGNTKAAQKSYETAAEWALMRGDNVGKGVAKNSRATAQFLAQNPDSKNVRITAWITILKNAADEKTQQRAIEEIEALGAKIYLTPQGQWRVKFPEED